MQIASNLDKQHINTQTVVYDLPELGRKSVFYKNLLA